MIQTVWDLNLHKPKKLNDQFPAFPVCNCFTQRFPVLKILIINIFLMLHFNFSLFLLI